MKMNRVEDMSVFMTEVNVSDQPRSGCLLVQGVCIQGRFHSIPFRTKEHVKQSAKLGVILYA